MSLENKVGFIMRSLMLMCLGHVALAFLATNPHLFTLACYNLPAISLTTLIPSLYSSESSPTH